MSDNALFPTVVVAIMVAVAILFGLCTLIIVNRLTEAENPETGVSDTMTSTSAPSTDCDISTVESSVPTTEETIPTEQTEPTETVPETTEPPETTESISAVDPDELEMLACVIFQEAGSSKHCEECKRRVADVVLNRMADPRFPDTMYEVLTAKNQYGKYYWTGIVWPDYASNPYEKPYIEECYRIAEEVLSGHHSDLYGKGYVWQASFEQSDDNIYCCGHYFGRGPYVSRK